MQDTRWSMVWRAGHAATGQMRTALQSLCQEYWPAVYAYIRRWGKSSHDAEDLTQAFFCHLFDSGWFSKAHPGRGRLRGFLYQSLESFLLMDHRALQSKKRSGNANHLQLEHAERIYTAQMSDGDTPDRVFTRQWVMTLIQYALDAMSARYARRGQSDVFAALLPFLSESAAVPPDQESPEAVAAALSMKPATFRVTLSRARESFREFLYVEVGKTMATSDPTELRRELEFLLGYL